MILDDPNYMTGSFDSFVTEDTDYFTWFLQSSIRPIMDDFLVGGGRELGGILERRYPISQGEGS